MTRTGDPGSGSSSGGGPEVGRALVAVRTHLLRPHRTLGPLAPWARAGGPAWVPPDPYPRPVFAGSDVEPSTVNSSRTWRNTGPDRGCVSKSRTRTKRSAVSCSSDLSCLGPRGGRACPPRPAGALGPQCLRLTFPPDTWGRRRPPGLHGAGSARGCSAIPPSHPRVSAHPATSQLHPSLCLHVLCLSVCPACLSFCLSEAGSGAPVPGLPCRPPWPPPGSWPLWLLVEGTGVLLTTGPGPFSPRPDLRSAP